MSKTAYTPEAKSATKSSIRPARSRSEIETTRSLFSAYAESLAIDLSFQDFQTELDSLPGKYAPEQGGETLLAFGTAGLPIGCVALRALGDPKNRCCEMKRLYVSPAGRGLGLGRDLATAIIGVARERNYQIMKLDTLPTMTAALALYDKLGFVKTESYYDTPMIGTAFLAKEL